MSQKIESLSENQQIKESDFQNKMILIEDQPDNFNQWYGILSSDKGGLDDDVETQAILYQKADSKSILLVSQPHLINF